MVYLNDIASRLNFLVVAFLRSPVHGLASKAMMLVTWTGRKSGRSFTIPVGYQREDAKTVIVMLSKPAAKSWWKNFRSPWPAELTIRGRVRNARGEWIEPGSPEFFERVQATLERLPWMGSQFGIQYRRGATLDDEQRTTLTEKCGAIRFELID